MRRLFNWRPRMAIRAYRQPIPRKFSIASLPINPIEDFQNCGYVDVFVIYENPLLELLQTDLVFLKECGIDAFTVVD